MKKIGRPELKPGRTFKKFCEDHRWLNRQTPYPCFSCDGTGRIYDPNDPPDPIEGNKLRRRIGCPHCNRTGETTEDVYRKAWRIERNKHRESKAKYQEMCNMLSSIEKRLTKEQIEFLNMHCSRCFSDKRFY